MLILVLQAMVIVAWEDKANPWQALRNRDVQVKMLTVFLTWSGLGLLRSFLDVSMEYSLISRETLWVGVKMLMKVVVAIA